MIKRIHSFLWVVAIVALLLSLNNDAFARERQIKGWSRRKKLALINGDWDKLKEYSRSKENNPSTSSG